MDWPAIDAKGRVVPAQPVRRMSVNKQARWSEGGGFIGYQYVVSVKLYPFAIGKHLIVELGRLSHAVYAAGECMSISFECGSEVDDMCELNVRVI